jgi:uncharacterized protein (UPF0332 family)
MDPREFLRLADELKVRRDEASHRSAVSRAYYAVHNDLAILLSGWGFHIPSGPEAHERVIMMLHNCGITEVQSQALLIRNFRNQRNNADYLLKRAFFPQMEAHIWCQNARTILAALQPFSAAGQDQERLKAGITDYLHKIRAS